MRILTPDFGRRSFLTAGAIAALSACTARSAPQPPAVPSAKASVGPIEKDLLLSNWVDFNDPENVKAFSKLFDVKVTQEGYGSQEELLSKLKAGGTYYDVVVPSGDGLKQMIEQKLVLPFNKDLIPNLANVKPVFRDNAFDPGNLYGAPKDYGILTFYWRTAVVKEQPKTMKECFELLAKYPKARTNVIESGAELIAGALAALGFSVNSVDENELEQAKQLLLAAKPGIDTISTQYIERGQRGEIDFGLGYSGDIRRIVEARAVAKDEVKFLIPEGKTEYFVDYWAIPAAAKHPVAAHKFINFVLDAKNAAAEMNYIQYGTPLNGVAELADPAIAKDPIVSIPDEALARYEIAQPLSAAGERLRSRIYTEFKAR